MQKVLFILRLAMGWLLLYGGLTKITVSNFSAAGYLKGAQTIPGFYHWLALPANIGWVSFLAEWGLTLLGVALILGAIVRLSGFLGALMMVLFYLPILHFPYAGDHSYIVDEHFIYVLVLLLLAAGHAGRYLGLDKKLQNTWLKFLT